MEIATSIDYDYKERNGDEHTFTPVVHQALEETKPYCLSNYYPYVKDCSPETYFVELSYEETLSIIAFHRQKFNKKEVLEPIHVEHIRNVEKRIDNVIQEHFKDQPFFPRYDTKSFKDGLFHKKYDFETHFNAEVERIRNQCDRRKWDGRCDNDEQFEANLKSWAMWIVHYRVFALRSAKECMSLMLSSVRGFQDNVMNTYHYKQNKKDMTWDLKLGLRKFVTNMRFDLEFRCFVYNNIMTCISKHDFIVAEEQLSYEWDEIMKKKLFYFWNEKIKNNLKHLKHYTADIAFTDKDEPFLVEINEHHLSDPFSFKTDEERDSILNGKYLGDVKEEDYSDKILFKVRKKLYPCNIKESEKCISEMFELNDDFDYDELLNKVDPPTSSWRCNIY